MNQSAQLAPQPSSSTPYVEQLADGNWRVAGSRVSLDSIVHAYHDGETPEQIVRVFPSLSIEQIYGTITFYLANQQEINAYLGQQTERWDRLRQKAATRNAALRERIQQRQVVPVAEDAAS